MLAGRSVERVTELARDVNTVGLASERDRVIELADLAGIAEAGGRRLEPIEHNRRPGARSAARPGQTDPNIVEAELHRTRAHFGTEGAAQIGWST